MILKRKQLNKSLTSF